MQELYGLGGRTFLVLNLAPMGCYAAVLTQVSHESSDIDQSGCMISFDNAVGEYNSVLKEAIQQARQELNDANVIYVDNYVVQLELYQNPTAHGFQLKSPNITFCNVFSILGLSNMFCPDFFVFEGLQHGITACCGYGGGSYNFDPQVFCGNTKEVNGQKVTASACGDPQNYVSWDGIHLTENANKMLTYAILSGSYFDPPFSINQYCDIQPIG